MNDEYQGGERCPECDSDDISHYMTEYHFIETHYDQCNECGHKWNIG